MRRFDDPFSFLAAFIAARETFAYRVTDALHGTVPPPTWTTHFVRRILVTVNRVSDKEAAPDRDYVARVLRELPEEPPPRRPEDAVLAVLAACDCAQVHGAFGRTPDEEAETPGQFVGRGCHRMKDGRLEDAFDDVCRAVELAPLDPEPYAARGYVVLEMGEPRLAHREFRLAVQLSEPPRRTQWRLDLASVLLDVWRPAEAEEEFRGHLAEVEEIAACPRRPSAGILGEAWYRGAWICLDPFARFVPQWTRVVKGLAGRGVASELEEAIVRVRDSLGMWQD